MPQGMGKTQRLERLSEDLEMGLPVVPHVYASEMRVLFVELLKHLRLPLSRLDNLILSC